MAMEESEGRECCACAELETYRCLALNEGERRNTVLEKSFYGTSIM